MKKIRLGRSCGFSRPGTLLFALAALSIVWFFGLVCLLLFVLMALFVWVSGYMLDSWRIELLRQLQKANSLADSRLALIRELITLSYETDKELFHRKFLRSVHVRELCRRKIIDIDCQIFREKLSYHLDTRDIGKLLTDADIELYCLLEHGFSSRELTVIYNLKNINSAYMKRYRLKNKLKTIANKNVLHAANQ